MLKPLKSPLLFPLPVKKSPPEGFTGIPEGIYKQLTETHFIISSTMNLKFQLEFYLKRHEITATTLARMAQVPRQNISNWLMNQKPKDVEQVKRVANVFQITIDHLLFGEGAETTSDSSKNPSGEQDWIAGTFEIMIRKVK